MVVTSGQSARLDSQISYVPTEMNGFQDIKFLRENINCDHEYQNLCFVNYFSPAKEKLLTRISEYFFSNNILFFS